MTDIKKELQEYKNHGYENIMSDFAKQEQELKEKKHMLNVHYVCTSLEKMIDNKEFDDAKILSVLNYSDYDAGYNRINFTLLDAQHEAVEKYNSKGNHTKPVEKTKALLDLLKYHEDLVSTSFEENKNTEISLDKNGIDRFRKFLLSEKLQNSLHHALLDTQLSDKASDPKKPKI